MNILSQKGYNGNNLLKKSDIVIEWTPELISEFQKCMNDPIYFAQNYVKIVQVDNGLTNLDLYDYQKEIINKAVENKRSVVLTARQAGKCVHGDTMITVRNKKTGEIMNVSAAKFFDKIKG